MGEMGRAEGEHGADLAELLNPERHIQRNKKDGFSSSLEPAGMLWWSHGQMCGTVRISCSGVPLLLPCAPAQLQARFPRRAVKCTSSFSQLLCPDTKGNPSPPCALHMQEMGFLWDSFRIPLGVLLAIFIFLSCVDLFLFNQVCSVHQSTLPSAESFNLKQISN